MPPRTQTTGTANTNPAAGATAASTDTVETDTSVTLASVEDERGLVTTENSHETSVMVEDIPVAATVTGDTMFGVTDDQSVDGDATSTHDRGEVSDETGSVTTDPASTQATVTSRADSTDLDPATSTGGSTPTEVTGSTTTSSTEGNVFNG